ncbi:unnamed protein product [Spirodela intermedia]|uniref:Uncharacterized protein n=1 Tax=Spirodela intermedia TaxID=51605 RepID=A0A7I8J8E5_SPIIN|nr:unnamed protein product [Spirodela intermedia]CAA6665723.1 unnamed protein product [Spirodela intermedia]
MDEEWGMVEEPMSPGSRLFHQPRFNCYIVALMGFGRRIDLDVVKAGLELTLIRHPIAEGRGRPRWVRTKVVLEDHLVVVEVDPRKVECPDRFLEDYVSELTKTTMEDFSKPLWELHLINLPTTEAESVAIFRIHHSLGDGTSLVSLLLACTRKAADQNSLPTLPTSGRTRRIPHRRITTGDDKRWWKGLLAMLLSLWAALRLAWNTAVDMLLFAATAAFMKDDETPVKGQPGVGFNPKRIVRRTLNFEDMKTIKKALGSTINDVLLGMTSAGLAHYLHKRYKEEGFAGRRTLPENLRVRSAVLVTSDQGRKGNMKWGNCLGCVIVPFPVKQCEDPLDYVRMAKAVADRKKHSLESVCTFLGSLLILKAFGIQAAAVLPHRVFSHTTFSFSNVIGPVEEIAFCGHPLVYLAPTVYGHPHALTVHFQSYMNRMELVIAADESVITDPHKLCEAIAGSLKQMKDAAATVVPVGK